MASKNISIKKETYDKLVALKKDNESFTDIIESLLHPAQNIGRNLEPFFGMWGEDPIVTVEMAAENRNEINKQLAERFE